MNNSSISRGIAQLLLVAAFVAGPLTLGTAGLLSYDQAFADKGGNGGDHGGGNGGGNSGDHGNSGNSSHDSSKAASADSQDKGPNIASKLGALNAAHASAQAFANASPNSRIGKIKAYAVANAAAQQSAAAVTEAQDKLNSDVSDIAKADGLTTDQINTALASDDPKKALTDLGVSDADAQKLVDDQTAVQTAEQAAAQDQQAATDALNAAANKTPVDAETKAALDALLVGKIPETTSQ